MKRVIIDHFGGPEVVSIVEDSDPRPGPGEVRIRVLASGVSLSDAQMRAGTYLGGPKPPPSGPLFRSGREPGCGSYGSVIGDPF